jgi:hypothetical protein
MCVLIKIKDETWYQLSLHSIFQNVISYKPHKTLLYKSLLLININLFANNLNFSLTNYS